jgi:uncharacterized protein YecE (DUF72 family)
MPRTPKPAASRIRVGIGGWTYEPWRDNFFPKGLPHSRELQFASRKVSAIEVNGTYYSTQKPATFAKWRDETPDDFVFSLKASRYTTNRRVLAEAGDSIGRFIDSGLSELGPKLGPIVWQFAPTKAFDADDFAAFLELLPKRLDGLTLRHVVDVRHESFMSPAYLALARRHRIATVFTDADDHPSWSDVTGDFVYARLMKSDEKVATGYAAAAIARWAEAARAWAAGDVPDGLPRIEAGGDPAAASRDVFVFFINGAKERAPAGAMALLDELGWAPPEPAWAG